MCFCCCITRKSILIYAIVICSFAFIYGIVAISKFGSSTDIYKFLIEKIKDLESSPASLSTESNGNNNYYNNYYNNDYDDDYNNYYNSYYKKKNNKTRKIQSIYNNDKYYYLLDSASYLKIQSLSPYHLQNRGYGLVKRLKGIENGLGVILFISLCCF